MSSKHTPGPWYISGDTRTWGASADDGSSVVKGIKVHADACLIAAAPDMHAALLLARDWLQMIADDQTMGRDPEIVAALIAADAAIAKATGPISDLSGTEGEGRDHA